MIYKLTEDDDYIPFKYVSCINEPLDKKQVKEWSGDNDFEGAFVTTIKKLDSKDFIAQKES